MTALLLLNRLSVHRGSHIMYDEYFHAGVNIIHGDNGSGKSTIADFIHFALGGDLKEWRREASLAHYVVAEIKAGNAFLTVRRDVSKDGLRPMQIYFGRYNEAIAADFRQWETFPYRRPEEGYSFSQVIFRAAGIPEAISDGLSNITMNQLLRVLYSDQLTPIQRIFRVEPFDTWQTRQAVGDVLCGVGGYDLYAQQIFLRDLLKEHDDVSAGLKNLISIAASHGDRVLAEHIDVALSEATERRQVLAEKVESLLRDASTSVEGGEADELVRKHRNEVLQARGEVADLADRIETLEFEIRDSDAFIRHLEESVSDFSDAASTFFALGAVRFEFCPSCFNPVVGVHTGKHACHLCGNTAMVDQDETRVLAVKLDLEMQINESQGLQAARTEELSKLKAKHRSANSRLRAAVAAREMTRRGAASLFEAVLADTSRQIGTLDAEIAALIQRQGLAKEIAALTEKKATLNQRISKLRDQIAATELVQKRRKAISYTEISERTKRLLEDDMAEHSDFGDIENIQFDFGGDWIAINGDKNRVGSASGMVILKNSFLLSLFWSSLEDDQFGLPRFMLMDNVEDKGMVQERSWNFQHLIVAVSSRAKVEHQFIYSTSKIAPEFENSPFVVGRKYTKAARTLNIGVARSDG